jgi:DNA polymerase-4
MTMKDMYPKKGSVILHVDMNSFYASVEAAYDPSLKGKPLAIAGNVEERRGIVVTSSYEARKHGVKTTMPVWEAKRACPGLMIMQPNFNRYRNTSKKIFQILTEVTEMVQPVSIDEGYVDITQCYELGSPLQIAENIQNRILKELDIPCSIGIAPNKFLAKTASDMKKPLGITILRKRDLEKVLWPQNVGYMHGIGNKTEAKLNKIGIKTIGDLASANDGLLKETIGISGKRMKDRANGIDDRPVDPDAVSEFKSIGSSTTLPEDTSNVKKVDSVLERLAQSVCDRLKRKSSVSLNIQLVIRYHDRKNVTRGRKLDNPISSKEEILTAARHLWTKHWNGEPVRLLGITAQDLLEKEDAYKQLDLFSYQNDAKKETLDETIDRIRKKYGDGYIDRTSSLKQRRHGQS